MKKNSLKFKILIIFSIPILVLMYLSYINVLKEFKQLNESSTFKISVQMTQTLNELIHSIQIERGLSAGIITASDNEIQKEKLLLQHKQTDESYLNLRTLVASLSSDKKKLEALVGFKANAQMQDIFQDMSNIKKIRAQVLSSSINFEDEMKYYTDINKKLIQVIKIFNTLFKNLQDDSISVLKLQELQEYAGLERAYIYNLLLSENINNKTLSTLKEFQYKQKELHEEYFINASENSTKIYKEHYNKDIKNELELCRNNITNNSLNSYDAQRCFEISTKYINIFSEISEHILDNYINKSHHIYNESLKSLYLIAILWFVSLLALILLTFILNQLMRKEDNYVQELRIASYAFDSQEAMTVTDIDGTIIKVNSSFSAMTGYSEDEAIGQNPRILKSQKHDENFYKDMWDNLLTNGKWQGEIFNKRKNGEIYPEILSITAIKDENNITTNYIAQFTDISEVKKAHEIAQHQADHDFLTGLINRKFLVQRLKEELSKAKRHNLVNAFLFIDLDNFKKINDYYGHITGDKLLKETAKRIESILREEDIASRISGDEFGLIILNLDLNLSEAARHIKQVCIKILQEISREFTIDSYTINISSSIGIKLFPDEERDVNDIIIHADKAMYEAKKQGKNQFVFFNDKIESQLKEFTILEQEIRDSIKNNNFEFYYQPKVNTQSGKVSGAELLIRWNHPKRGLLYPDSFITMAENIGVIHKFSTFALHTACKFIKSNVSIFNGTLAININSQELLHPNFDKEIITIISSYKIDPSRIELEITESAIIENFDLVVSKIKRLQKYGVKFAIDDFGTGYSSITYLQKLPVDTLKIDRSFLQDLSINSNKELIKMIINMAKYFNMDVITEGIENEEQLNFIKENNSHYYQGFYFSKAVDEASFIKIINS